MLKLVTIVRRMVNIMNLEPYLWNNMLKETKRTQTNGRRYLTGPKQANCLRLIISTRSLSLIATETYKLFVKIILPRLIILPTSVESGYMESQELERLD